MHANLPSVNLICASSTSKQSIAVWQIAIVYRLNLNTEVHINIYSFTFNIGKSIVQKRRSYANSHIFKPKTKTIILITSVIQLNHSSKINGDIQNRSLYNISKAVIFKIPT